MLSDLEEVINLQSFGLHTYEMEIMLHILPVS